MRLSRPYRAIWSAAPAAIVLLDGSGRITGANPAADRVLGPVEGRLAGTEFARLFVDTRVQVWLADVAVSPLDTSVAIEAILCDGRTVDVRATNRLRDPELRAVVIGVADVTAQKHAIRDLEAHALYDHLTGLANRVLLQDRLSQARRTTAVSAALVVDLDNFKAVNDRHGHVTGDEVLRLVAGRLSVCVRPTATVARLGGDEFVVLLPGDGEEEAAAVAARLVEAIREPVDVHGSYLSVSGSVGVATTEGAFQDDTVLRRADIALYRAKADGRNRHAVFRPDMADWAGLPRRAADVVAALRERNAELERLVRTDEVTGLDNLRAYFERVEDVHTEAVRSGRPYSVVFCDLDRFGLLNKHLGQQAGDAVLRTVASALVENARAGDEVYRRGGEELVVILPDTPRAAARAVAERLRRAVESLAFENPDLPIVTMSAGVATLDPDRHRFPADVERDADRAMVTAKTHGRNRVVVAQPA